MYLENYFVPLQLNYNKDLWHIYDISDVLKSIEETEDKAKDEAEGEAKGY